jgi:hypothetical protein
LAAGQFRIEAGTRAKLRLAIDAFERPQRVAMRGTVVIPDAWGIAEPRLRVEVRGEMVSTREEWLRWLDPGEHLERVGEGSDTWRFDLGRLPPSRAVIHVEGTGVRSVVGIEADPTEVEIHVPPPAKVSVRVLDVRTGTDAEVEYVMWHIEAPDGKWHGIHAKKDPDRARFEFLAPVGATVGLHADVVSALDHDDEVEVTPGGVEKTIRIDPAGSVLIVLMDGEARLPHHDWAELLKGEEDMAIAWGNNDEGCVVHAREPGRFRLRLADYEGFEPIPDREVTIEPGLQTRVTIPLVRKP